MTPLDLAHNGTKPVKANQDAPGDIASNQDLSERPEPQLAEYDVQHFGGNGTLQRYIKGKCESTTEISYLKHTRPRTSMHNGGAQLSAARYSQARRCWTCYWGKTGLVVEKGVKRHVEAGIKWH